MLVPFRAKKSNQMQFISRKYAFLSFFIIFHHFYPLIQPFFQIFVEWDPKYGLYYILRLHLLFIPVLVPFEGIYSLMCHEKWIILTFF